MATIQLLGPLMGIASACGINLYATILTIGLGTRFGFLQLPPDLVGLSILASPYVLLAAGIAYAIEFFVDKIPWVDSIWDAIHTVIRPIGAVILGMTALSNMDPAMEVAILILCGGLALTTHSTKAGTRIIANHSPEPFTNIGLSLIEDVLAVVISWLSIKHPLFIFSAVLVFLFIFIFIFPKIFRLIRLELTALRALFRSLFISKKEMTDDIILFDQVPDRYSDHIVTADIPFCIRCGAGKGVNVGRNCLGFLYLFKNHLSFTTRKNFRYRTFDIDLNNVKKIKHERKIFFDRLILELGYKKIYFNILKHSKNRINRIFEIIEQQRLKVS
jgi:hypothetical protein